MNVEPLGARVLIRPAAQEMKTASGLLLPESASEKPQQGYVDAVGNKEELITDLSVGDLVLFPKYAGTEIKIDGTDYILMDESDVLARLKE